jgi:hypothetical protein
MADALDRRSKRNHALSRMRKMLRARAVWPRFMRRLSEDPPVRFRIRSCRSCALALTSAGFATAKSLHGAVTWAASVRPQAMNVRPSLPSRNRDASPCQRLFLPAIRRSAACGLLVAGCPAIGDVIRHHRSGQGEKRLVHGVVAS